MLEKQLKAIHNGDRKPVYFAFGSEYYLIEQVKQALLQQKNGSTDELMYDLRETAIQDVITDAETFPFFSEHKLIFAYHPVFVQTKPDKTTVVHDTEVLEKYLAQPADYSTLVLIAPYEKLDGRKKATKQLKKHAVTIECNPLKGKDLQRFMRSIVKQEGIEVTPEAYALLETEFESDLYMLQKEINKLALYVGEGEVVTKEIAEQLISPSRQFNGLQFVDAVLKRDLAQAVKIYKELEKMKEEPIGLIALLAYQFRIILQVKLMLKKGYPADRLKSELKVHPYVVQLAVERSRYFTEEMLQSMMDKLTEADTNIKRGKMDKGIAFEMLLYQLTALANRSGT